MVEKNIVKEKTRPSANNLKKIGLFIIVITIFTAGLSYIEIFTYKRTAETEESASEIDKENKENKEFCGNINEDGIEKSNDRNNKLLEKDSDIQNIRAEKIADEENLSFHKHDLIHENTELFNKNILQKQLTQYRLYLFNANELLTKFRNDEEFGAELAHFKLLTHPREINNILLNLQQYNEILAKIVTDKKEIQVKIFGITFTKKILKITKLQEVDYKQIELKKQISDKLFIFINYIYALELQNRFIN